MSRLQWGGNAPLYEAGVDRGVLYFQEEAIPWNGLVSVEEQAAGAVDTEHYFDGNRVHISQDLGDFSATVSAYTYPDRFDDVASNSAARFNLSYRTQHGSSHRIHLVYNVTAQTNLRAWRTLADQPTPALFNWDIRGEAALIPGSRPSSHLYLEAPEDPYVLEQVEELLYGTDTTEPRLPTPEELVDLYETFTVLRITNHGDGSYTAEGPDDIVRLLPDGQFELNAPSAFVLENGIFIVNSY